MKELKQVLAEALKNKDEFKQVMHILAETKKKDKGFDYRVSYDAIGDVTAIVWQNKVMRGHCKWLLDVLMLDVMKRQQNSVDFPYCGVALLTGEKKVALGSESIMVEEMIPAYVFVVRSTFEMANIPLSMCKVIFGDGIMSTSLLKELGIENTCKLILDKHHLVEID